MTLDSKIELVRYKILHQRIGYNLEILDLLRYLTDEIDRIDERTFSFDVEPEDNKITVTRFLKYMDEYINCIKTHFHHVIPFHCILRDSIEGNKQEISNLLNCVGGDDYFFRIDKNSEVEENIYKLSISNFIKNSKYIPTIEKFLNENNLQLKPIDQYTLKESKQILKLLSNLVFSLRGRGGTFYLFENLDVKLEGLRARKKRSKSKKYTLKDYENKFIDDRIEEYDKMFKIYNNKKKYLKYFI